LSKAALIENLLLTLGKNKIKKIGAKVHFSTLRIQGCQDFYALQKITNQ
jgi:hypothetical protein